MENVEDSRDGKTNEVKTKGAKGISLRACVAKAAGWTLEKANSTTSQEASINKARWSKIMWESLDMKVTFQAIPSSMECMWFSKPPPGLGRLRVVGLASHTLIYILNITKLYSFTQEWEMVGSKISIDQGEKASLQRSKSKIRDQSQTSMRCKVKLESLLWFVLNSPWLI